MPSRDSAQHRFTPTLAVKYDDEYGRRRRGGEQGVGEFLARAPHSGALPVAIDTTLGTAWDAELEPFRQAAADRRAARLLSVV